MALSFFARAGSRTLVMSAVAIVLAVLTYIDQTSTRETGGRESSLARDEVPLVRTSAGDLFAEARSAGETWRELQKLNIYAANSDLIRKRYQSVSVPYSEAVASLTGLQYGDDSPVETTEKNIRTLIPKGVDISALMLSSASGGRGVNANMLVAKVSLESMDSRAMLAALLLLGDPETGKRWLELTVAADEAKRKMFATGTLEILSLRAAE